MKTSVIGKRTTLTVASLTLLLLLVAWVTPTVANQADESWGVNSRNVDAAVAKLHSDHPTAKLFSEDSHLARVYGTTLANGSSPEAAADQFMSQYAGIFGAKQSELHPQSRLFDKRHTQQLMYNKETGEYKFTLVYYSQYRNDVPVFRSDLRVLVRNEPNFPVVLAASDLRDLGDFQPAMSKAQFDPAIQAQTGMVNFSEPQTVIWAGVDKEKVRPRLAVTFSGWDDRADNTHEDNLYVCDATTGEILYKESNIHFLDVSGSVQAMATPGSKANTCTPEILFPYPWARVQIQGGSSVYADGNGNYTIPNLGTGSVTVVSYVDGLYFTIDNRAGSEETLSQLVTPPGPANFIHNEANNSDFILAQTNIYVAANECRDWVLAQNPTYPGISTETGVLTVVNRTDLYCPCNAWSSSSDGSINFCQPGDGCPNTAWQSVENHEYGHHVIDFSSSGQGEYGEGMGDCIAVLVVDDPNLGYGFFGDCNSGLRTADNNCQYSATGCSSCGSEIHDCGNLLSGCVWDVRNELTITEPVDYLEIISNIVVNSILLHTGTGINSQIPIDFLTLDDDDANLDNGTPHWEEICTGFSAHGIDCPELTPIFFTYPNGQPDIVQPLLTTAVHVVVNSGSLSPVSGSAELYYSIDGAPFQTGTMTQTATNEYDAILPGADCDSHINWYVSAEASGFGTVTDPSNAPTTYFSAVVATSVNTVFSDNFQTNQGWTVSGDAGDGQWTRGTPVGGGDRGDPPTDYDGSGMCYLTDNTDGNSDVDDGTTILTSPTFDLSAGDGQISYARWYSNNTGDDPNNDVFEVYVSNNGGLGWTLVETVGPVDQANGGWYEHSFTTSDFVTPSAIMKVKFEASDLGAGSIVEAGVDDFKVVVYECQPTGQVIITTETLPEWTEGVAGYSASLQAVYGTEPYTWSDEFGDLAGTGLTLAGDGTISGTPTSAGTISFTAYVEDDLATFDEQPLEITINSAPQVTTTTLPDWTVNRFYNQSLAATGGTDSLVWSDVNGDLAGTGLQLDDNTGLVFGIPASAGPISFTARVTDGPGATGDQLFNFTINPSPQITSTSPLLGWGQGQPGYSVTLTSTGGTTPVSWTNPGGGLSGTGLTLSSAGVVSGTPTASDTITFAARISDQAGASDNEVFQIPIFGTVTITSVTLPEWTVSQPGYSYSLAAAGGDGNYIWSDLNGDLAGTGLSLASNGTLSGTPSSAGLITFTAQVEDGLSQSDQQEFNVTINELPQLDTDSVLAEWTVNQSGYGADLSVTGGTGAMSYTPTSSNGISLNLSGHVYGTPGVEGEIVFTAEVADETGATDTQNYIVPVNPRPGIDTDALPEWTVNHPGYNEMLTASGGTGALSFTAQSFDGLSLNTAGNLTGTPNTTGDLNFNAEVGDATGATEQKALSVHVNDAVAITTASTLPEGTEGDGSYSVQLEATGGTGALGWSEDGSLSGTGLMISGTGEVSGTPAAAGTIEFTAYATDAVGADDSQLFSILVNPAYICGDASGDDLVNITDATYIIQWIFADGPAPDPLESGDADCDGAPNITDAVYIITFIFAGGPEPCANCGPVADQGRKGGAIK